MRTLWLDLETASSIPISAGVFKYAEDARILLLQCAWDNDPVNVIEWPEIHDEKGQAAIVKHTRALLDQTDVICAHNVEFDFTILDRCYGLHVPIEKRYCTMAQARRHGLPGSLDALCDIFKLPQDLAKMKEGHELVLLFCKPRPDGTWATKHTHPQEWARFKAYGGRDIVAMRELHYRMPRWNDEYELPIWRLDQKINARGFGVDRQLAENAVALLKGEKERLGECTVKATNGEVDRATQRDRFLAHLLKDHGVELPDLTKATIERRLGDPDLPEEVKELLRLRQDSSKTSTGKYKALLDSMNADERLRGSLVYCGAGRTRRWAGAKFQPQNLPRPTLKQDDTTLAVRAFRAGVPELLGDHPLTEYAANAIRGCVVPQHGRKLIIADLANIEGRVVAWLAEEHWKLEAFRVYDAGTGPDLYRVAYASAFNEEPDAVDDTQRQIGKVMELMLGYQGSVGAFVTGATTYRVDLEAMARACWPLIPADVRIECEVFWAKAKEDKRTYGLSQDVFMACDALKRLWRRRHPRIEAFWFAIEDAARITISTGKEQRAGRLCFTKEGAWLRMHLPSGGMLCYPSPRVDETGRISFMGQSPYTRAWARQTTYGGKLVENATQAVARDVLAEGLLAAEAAGLSPVLHVHDEILCEVSAALGVETLVRCMTTGRPWTKGLPLAAKGFETDRYYKG